MPDSAPPRPPDRTQAKQSVLTAGREAVNKPPRAATYANLDTARRKAQDAEDDAKRSRQPEPGIYCATYPLPDLGPPTERMYNPASPVLGLPVEVLEWRDKDTGKRTVIHRFRCRIHGYDD